MANVTLTDDIRSNQGFSGILVEQASVDNSEEKNVKKEKKAKDQKKQKRKTKTGNPNKLCYSTVVPLRESEKLKNQVNIIFCSWANFPRNARGNGT